MNEFVYLHNLDPVAFKLFGLNVYWYSLSYLFGFIFSVFFSHYLIKNNFIKLDSGLMDDFLTWAIIGVILGGRLGYVFFYNLNFYFDNLQEIFYIWKGGMSFHGGLIGLILSTIIFSRLKKVSFLELSNLVASCAPIGIFLGRLANFVNGELIGRPTNSQWGVLYEKSGILRHPSQLYEALFEGIIIFIIINFFYKNKYYIKINIFSVFLILYSSARFLLEFFREPDQHLGFILGNLTMGQLLSIPMFLVGILLLTYGKTSKNKRYY